jgi:hypothetical protein
MKTKRNISPESATRKAPSPRALLDIMPAKKAVSVPLRDPSDNPYAAFARTTVRSAVQAAATLVEWQTSTPHDVNVLAAELAEQAGSVSAGDLRRLEEMLTAQAHTLDEIFNNLARRAASNLGHNGMYMGAVETYLKLALRAQSQTRSTIEAVALLKNPQPVAFVRQANIGQAVQVNNVASRAAEKPIPPSKLLEANDENRLDGSAQTAAGVAHSPLETLGALDRPANAGRQGHCCSKRVQGRGAADVAQIGQGAKRAA